MKDIKTKERFVELRAQGKPYSEIAQEIGVSKQTLVTWSREFNREISNLRNIEWEVLYQKFLVGKERRIALFAKVLEKVVAEVEKRELSDMESTKLFEVLLKYVSALKSEESNLVFRGTESAMKLELEKEVFWSA